MIIIVVVVVVVMPAVLFVNRESLSVDEETHLTLGLSPELTKDYIKALDLLGAWVDEPKVLGLDIKIRKAIDEFDPVLQKQLIQQKTSLRLSDHVLTQSEVSSSIESLQKNIKASYVAMTQNNNFDIVVARKCALTLKYVDELVATGADRNKLFVALGKRFASKNAKYVSSGSNIKQFEWDDIKVPYKSMKEAYIGKGSFASVFKAQLQMDSRVYDVAIKVYHQEFVEDYPEKCSEAVKEAEIIADLTNLVKVNKDMIVCLYGVVMGPLSPELSTMFGQTMSRVALVMRLEVGGSVEALLYPDANKTKRPLNIEYRLGLLRSICDGLHEIHVINGAHGDLKPSNVLLKNNVMPDCCLVDFGLSEIKAEKQFKEGSIIQESKSMKGTKLYCAPEMVKKSSGGGGMFAKADRKTDMYAFSLLAFEVLTGKKPFFGEPDDLIISKIIKGERPDISLLKGVYPPGIVEMIEKCWSPDRNIRLTATECYAILSHNLSVVKEHKFDIFFSHAWANKPILSHVYKWLTGAGFRVWYDQTDMGYDLKDSMIDGITRSTIVLACVNSRYETRPNCMFEVKESVKRFPGKNIVALVLEKRFNKPQPWVPTQELEDLLKFKDKMYCDMSDLADDPVWDENAPVPPSADQVNQVKLRVEALIKILNDAGCQPSML